MIFDLGEHPLRHFFRTDIGQSMNTQIVDVSDPNYYYLYLCIASMYDFNAHNRLTPTNDQIHFDINNYLVVTAEEVLGDVSTPRNARSFKYPKLSMIFSFKGDFFQKMASFFKGVHHQKEKICNSDKMFVI